MKEKLFYYICRDCGDKVQYNPIYEDPENWDYRCINCRIFCKEDREEQHQNERKHSRRMFNF